MEKKKERKKMFQTEENQQLEHSRAWGQKEGCLVTGACWTPCSLSRDISASLRT